MRLLVLGGTAWLGSTIAATAVEAGHQVTCLARGAGIPAGAKLVRADRDDENALAAVADSRWDAVIDVGREPGHIRRAVRDLAPDADRYIFVSTVNVYASNAELGADEDAALLEPLAADSMASPDDYGPAKVACEKAVLDGFGADRSAIVRPGLIGGPGDPTGRTGYWPRRFAHPADPGGRVLVPDAPQLPVALIDVRDLAEWIVLVAETGASGVFNAVGRALPFPEHLAHARDAAGHAGPVVSADERWLLARGVAEWSGPRSLPLWLADPEWYGMNVRSTTGARAAGLKLRPLSETLADGLAWDLEHGSEVAHGAGLTDEEERELLAALDS